MGLADNMLQRKCNKIFKGFPDVFGKADDTLIVGYDVGGQVMQICHCENLTLYKNKCHLRCTKIPFFKELISMEGVQADPEKVHVLTEMTPLYTKTDYNPFWM